MLVNFSRVVKSNIKLLIQYLVVSSCPSLSLLRTSNLRQFPFANSSERSSISSLALLYAPFRFLDSTIGDFSYISENSSVLLTDIGRFSSIGPNFLCGWGIHPLDCISTSPMFYSPLKQNGTTLSTAQTFKERSKVIIGNDVFIGSNVTVLDGVTIGDGSVVGAGTIVSKDVQPYSIVAGNPMRIIRYRFSHQQIECLMSIRWWDWPQHRLAEVKEYFSDIDRFIDIYYVPGSSSYEDKPFSSRSS